MAEEVRSSDTCACGHWMLKTPCPLCEKHIQSPNVITVGDWTTVRGKKFKVLSVGPSEVVVRHGILQLEIPMSYTDAADMLRGRKMQPAVL